MGLDDMKFDNDEDRRKYLADLARLKRIREEERLTKERLSSYIREENSRSSNNFKNKELEIPNFRRKDDELYYDEEVYSNDDYDEYGEYEYVPRKKETRRVNNPTSKLNHRNNRNNDREIRESSNKNIRNSDREVRESSNKNIRNSDRVNRNISSNKDMLSKKKKKKVGIIFLQLLALCILGFGIYIAFLFLNTKESGYYNVAIFGVDSRDGNLKKGALADVNMIASINRATGDINLVSVYRDSYTEIDGKGTFHKLNEAYFKGGPSQAIGALERNLDLKIDDYATFNWKAVIETINILGGVDLEITEPEFKYINGFITETVNSTGIGSVQLKKPGMQHLDGVQAVAYARLRLMDTDYNRTERQRKVVSLAFDKAKNADFMTLQHILTTVMPQISTSVGIDNVLPFAKNITKYHLGKTTGFPFEKDTKVVNKRDYVIVVSLRNNVIALHKFLYGDSIAYTPSPALDALSKLIIKNTGIGANAQENIDVKNDDNSKGYIGNKETKAVNNKKKDNAKNSDSNKETTKTDMENTKETLKESIKESSTSSNEKNIVETEKNIVNIEENDDWNKETNSAHKTNNDDTGNGPAFNKNNEQTNAPTKSTENIENGPGIKN